MRVIALIRQYQQIFGRIAGAVAISMMDEFPWQKWMVQEVFRNFSVQQRSVKTLMLSGNDMQL